MNFDCYAFYCNADPDSDPAFYLNADPNIAPLQSDGEFATTGPLTLQGSILSLQASIVSVHSLPRLYFEPLKLMNFDFNADLDQAFHSNADPDPAGIRNPG